MFLFADYIAAALNLGCVYFGCTLIQTHAPRAAIDMSPLTHPVSVLVLQNLREGQGQTSGGAAALLADSNLRASFIVDGRSADSSYYSLTPLGPSSSASTADSSISYLLAAQQYDRPTTYRPTLLQRSDDRVQIIQAVDYHVPKSLKPKDSGSSTIPQPQQQQFSAITRAKPSFLPTIRIEDTTNFGTSLINRDTAIDPATTRSYQPDTHSLALNSEGYDSDTIRVVYPDRSTTYHPVRDTILRAVSQHQQPNHQASYARLRSFQGDRRVDSYIRY